MKYEYVAFMHKIKKTYTVCFPDFEGLLCAGRNPFDGKKNARDGLIFHIDGLQKAGEGIPLPRKLEQIKKSFEIDKSLIPIFIEVDVFMINEQTSSRPLLK